MQRNGDKDAPYIRKKVVFLIFELHGAMVKTCSVKCKCVSLSLDNGHFMC